jgi:hypothetical protein
VAKAFRDRYEEKKLSIVPPLQIAAICGILLRFAALCGAAALRGILRRIAALCCIPSSQNYEVMT